MKPKVTCIISSYNRPTLLRDALESLAEQTLLNHEVIVADDDSDAATLAVADEFAARDPRVKVLRQAAGRPTLPERSQTLRYCATINAALEITGGEYVCYLPDDDYLYPESLQVRAEVLDTRPDVDVVYGRLRSVSYDVGAFWDTRGVPLPGRTYPKYGEIDPDTGNVVNPATWEPGFGLPAMGGHIDHSQYLHRRSVLERLSKPYWPVLPVGADVGDAAFLKRLDALGLRGWGVDAMVTSKRYHGRNFDKAAQSTVRE